MKLMKNRLTYAVLFLISATTIVLSCVFWSEGEQPALAARQPKFVAEPTVSWAVEREGAWDGWKPDIERLRAARKKQPLKGYLYSEEVAWQAYHDICSYHLKDGRVLTADLNGWTFEEILSWGEGEKLFLCYDEKRGATLRDPDSGRWLQVFLVFGKDSSRATHPIDDYIASLEACSTYDMMSASYEGMRLMRIEIDRCVRRVLALKYLPEDERKNFIRLTKTRLDYCEMQGSFTGAVVHAVYKGGTGAGPSSMAYEQGLYHQALVDLLRRADEFKVFDEPLPSPGQ